MYSVSQDYLDALDAPVQIYRITGTVGSVSFTKANIVKGKLRITNKVSEGSEVKLGSVYIGELRATFTGLNIARGAWVGKAITLSEGLLTDPDTDTYEDVPLGVFKIAEANHTLEGVEVVAYDAMNSFDKAFTIDQTNGKAYTLLSYACTQCGVTLGNTQVQIEALTNGNTTLYLSPENDIETFRDFVSWIAQTLGCVATINRSGYLEIRQYSTTSAMSIDEQHRFSGCSFSDFTVKYTATLCTVPEENEVRYKSVSPDDGLTYNLGTNPFMQGIDGATLQQNLTTAFSSVQLVPFSAQMLGGAIFDLCDCLTFTGGVAAGAVVGVMGYSYTYNGGYKVEGYGSNPDLANARNKTDKDITGLISQTDLDKPRIFAFTNAEAITIGDGQTKTVAYLHVVAKKKTRFVLQVEVNHTASTTETATASAYTCTDLNITGKIYINNVLQDFSPVEVEQDGVQGYFITFTEEVPQEGTEVRVDLTCSGGSISVALGDVEAYLMGPGFDDFKIESITVVTFPSYLFQYGTVRYDGMQIDGVFNDGSQLDVTSKSTITPSEGTAIAGDAESVHMKAVYGDLEKEFDAPVQSLFEFNRGVALATPSNRSAGSVFKESGSVYTLKTYDNMSGSTKYYRVYHSKIAPDADNKPVVTQDGVALFTFDGNSSLFDTIILGRKFIVGACRNWTWQSNIQKLKYYDYETDTYGDYDLTFTYVGHENDRTITFVNSTYSLSNHLAARSIDGYMIFPSVTIDYTPGSNSKNGYMYGVIENGGVHLYFVEGTLSRLDAWKIRGNCLFEKNGNTLNVTRFNFNPTDGITYTLVTSLDVTGWGSDFNKALIDGTNKVVIYNLASEAYILDISDGTYEKSTGISQTDEFYQNTINNADKISWYADQNVYVYMEGDNTWTIGYLYFSTDLKHWQMGGNKCGTSGQWTDFEGSYASNLVPDGDCLIGTCFNGAYEQIAYTAVLNVDLTE